MTKATTTLASLCLFFAVWLAAFYHAQLFPTVNVPSCIDKITPTFPLWVLVSFGAYSLGSIGWNLFTFGDCPEAHEELMKEIKTAKSELKKKGVTVN